LSPHPQASLEQKVTIQEVLNILRVPKDDDEEAGGIAEAPSMLALEAGDIQVEAVGTALSIDTTAKNELDVELDMLDVLLHDWMTKVMTFKLV
jgi:hypothetical protein